MKKLLIIAIIVIIAAIGAVYFLQPKSAENPPSNAETSQTPLKSAGETYNVSIENFSFKPAEINIEKGDTVVWTNQDSAPHKISGSGFGSDAMAKGQSYSFTFSDAGTFDYICSIHPSMKGKITVK